jgi:hypothetical protein
MDNKIPDLRTSALSLLTLVTLCACSGVGGKPPTPSPRPLATATIQPTLAEASQGRCGDGVCDAAEKADPDLCPEDCRDQATTEKPTPESERHCGDGVCDGPETADTCPEDCAAEEGSSRETPTSPPPSATLPPAEATPTREPSNTTQLVSLPDGSMAIEGNTSTVTQEGGAGRARETEQFGLYS